MLVTQRAPSLLTSAAADLIPSSAPQVEGETLALKRDNLIQRFAITPLAPADGELPEAARQATSAKITGYNLESGSYTVRCAEAPPS